MGNSIGLMFRVTTFGESHGPAVGCVVDGCPSRVRICRDDIQQQLNRRRPGLPWTSPRQEQDQVEILSGIEDDLTLGTPIHLLVHNRDTRSSDYDSLRATFRPSHADYTYFAKYGIRTHRGGGRSSGRETLGRVAAGAIASGFLKQCSPISICAWVTALGTTTLQMDPLAVDPAAVDRSPVRCPDPGISEKMAATLGELSESGDSIGGMIECRVLGVPPGLGEPVFDKLHADLAKAMVSIPGCRGFEIGAGFAAATMLGSRHNDPFIMRNGKVATATNHSGGIQGGISNGEPILFRIPFKPPASIRIEQQTVTASGEPVRLSVQGRHDPCIVIRAVPVVEAMTSLVVADHWLRQAARRDSEWKAHDLSS
jgi:chorismate synthase